MSVFSVDTRNADQNIPTNKLRKIKTYPTPTPKKPVSFVIVSGGVGRIYTAITHWMNTLAYRDPSLHDKIFAIEGEVINNHGHMVEVERTIFNIPTTAVHILTVRAILVAITTDPSIAEMGPYVASDAGVETVKVQKICPVPHSLGGVFLHQEEVTCHT